jgi:hypothetical protein
MTSVVCATLMDRASMHTMTCRVVVQPICADCGTLLCSAEGCIWCSNLIKLVDFAFVKGELPIELTKGVDAAAAARKAQRSKNEEAEDAENEQDDEPAPVDEFDEEDADQARSTGTPSATRKRRGEISEPVERPSKKPKGRKNQLRAKESSKKKQKQTTTTTKKQTKSMQA